MRDRSGISGDQTSEAAMAGSTTPKETPVIRKEAVSELSQVFRLDAAGLDWPRAILFLDLALVPLVVLWTIGYEQYLLGALFGLLLAALDDPGGRYGHRAAHVSAFALIGAGLTAWAFGIGGAAWGWLVLAAFAVTLLAGLAVAFGVRRFVTALLLNIWFVVALALSFQFHQHDRPTSHVWAQVLAWTGGAALWLAVTFLAWLARGREDRPRPVAELPGDTSRQPLTGPSTAFAVIRAGAVAAATALAFGLDLSYGYWIPIAAVIAMKPSLEQTTLVASQRLVGALIGAAAASLLILLPASQTGLKEFAATRGLEVVALVLLTHAVAIRFWNHALYCAAVAAGVLILVSLPHRGDYAVEGYRVLWTACGVAIGVGLMLLAARLAGRDDGEP
ncbi:FUSC family protein [Streptomyces phytophilus]|uniref:FUSC family protein n=1 Tax=Streptomyces phytophilus TaxID=722715 RepID=UPI00215D9FBB|nr:FUSC family protein [Streptomyces phytophilus]